MKRAEIVKHLAELEARHDALEAVWEPLNKIIRPESEIREESWRLFHAYTRMDSDRDGDFYWCLNWYCYENEMGKKKFSSSSRNDIAPRKIKNLSDLAWLIETSEPG